MSNSAHGRCRRLLLAGVWTLGCWVNAPSAAAQPTPAPGPKFEVATIRQARPTAPTPQGGVDQSKGAVAPSRGGARVNAPAPPPPPPGSNCFGRTTMDAGRIDRYCVSLRELLLEVFAVGPARLFARIGPKLRCSTSQRNCPRVRPSSKFGRLFNAFGVLGAVFSTVFAFSTRFSGWSWRNGLQFGRWFWDR